MGIRSSIDLLRSLRFRGDLQLPGALAGGICAFLDMALPCQVGASFPSHPLWEHLAQSEDRRIVEQMKRGESIGSTGYTNPEGNVYYLLPGTLEQRAFENGKGPGAYHEWYCEDTSSVQVYGKASSR